MSDAINNAISVNSYGIIGQLVSDSAAIQAKENTLTEQSSSGLVSTSYSGLGTAVNLPLSLQPVIQQETVWQNNIAYAAGKMGVIQATMTRLNSIATSFYAQMANLDGIDPTDINSIAATANTALQQVANLLDTQDGSAYVFAGQDSGNPPIPDSQDILTSSFYTSIASEVGNLTTQGAATTAANTLAIASSNTTAANGGTSPFSTYLSQPAADIATQTVQVGANSNINIGLLASANTYAVSEGSSTTGSYSRDLMRALATIGSLTQAQYTSDPTDFDNLVSDTRTSLQGVISALNVDAGALGDLQTQMTQTQTDLSNFATALTNQVSNVQDVDMAATLSSLTTVQNELQASYQLISKQQSLSLIYYL